MSWVVAVAAASAAWGEMVETQDGVFGCWSARPGRDGLVCVTSNGVVTIPWMKVTDERFPAPDLDPPASAEWYERIGRYYAEIDGVLMRRELVSGRILSVVPAAGLLLVRDGENLVAVAGIKTEGLVDGSPVEEWCVRDGEHQYESAGNALRTVARYRVVPAISLEAFGRRPESAYPRIALERAVARQAASDAAMEAARAAAAERQRRLDEKAEASRAHARKMAEAERARQARVHEQFRMK